MIQITYSSDFVLVQCIIFNAICYADKHFQRNTQDHGIIARFEGVNGAMDDYCVMIQDIINLEFRCFFVYVVGVKWFKEMVERCPNATIRVHASVCHY